MDPHPKHQGLSSLAEAAREELSRLNFPPQNWVPASDGPDGRPLLDVLVVGGGMCGQTAVFALMREGVRNLRCLDRAPHGREGPWATFARMDTLRSPKHLTGPDLGCGMLTYRAWHEAKYGRAHWQALHKIAKLTKSILAGTRGPRGTIWLDERGGLQETPAFPVHTVDTLGAGDVFHGAFALAITEGQELREALRFASAAAALKCTRFGGAFAAPQRAEVTALLGQGQAARPA